MYLLRTRTIAWIFPLLLKLRDARSLFRSFKSKENITDEY